MGHPLMGYWESRKNHYYNELRIASDEKIRLTDLKESLERFHRIVQASEGDFHSFNSSMSDKTFDLEDVKKDTNIVDQYAKGMRQVLSSIGTGSIGDVYYVLVNNIPIYLRDYQQSIDRQNSRIDFCWSKINKYINKINEHR